jgi:hypothetical protein
MPTQVALHLHNVSQTQHAWWLILSFSHVCGGVCVWMWVYIRTHARTYAYARALSPAHTHANAQAAPHEHQIAVFASDLQCVYLYYTPTHISTIPCCACSLHHRRTNTRTHAHTRAHMHRAREKERAEQAQSDAGADLHVSSHYYMCPHTTLCVSLSRFKVVLAALAV